MKSFKQMISDKEIKRADMMKVQLEDLHEEPGFNLRDLDEVDPEDGRTGWERINDLAEYIADGGIYPALEVRPRADGGVWIVEGHRRTLALRKLDAEGRLPRTPNKEDPAILEAWVPIVQFVGNDADRVARIFTSQNNEKLSMLAAARGVKRLAAFGLSNQEIAAKIGKTPQRVAQLMELATANTDVQKMVAAGGVSAAVAVDVVRKHGDNAGKVLGDAMEQAKAAGKKKVTPKALNQDKSKALPQKVAQELETAAWELSKHLDFKTHEVLERGLRSGVGTIAGDDVLVPAGFLLELVMAAQAANDARGNQAVRVLADKQIKAQQKLDGVA